MVGYEPSAQRVVASRIERMYGPASALMAPAVASNTTIAPQSHQPRENHEPSMPAITPNSVRNPSEAYIGRARHPRLLRAVEHLLAVGERGRDGEQRPDLDPVEQQERCDADDVQEDPQVDHRASIPAAT